jgi:hypothetical protein
MAWMIMMILLLVFFSFDIGLAFGGIFWVLVFLFWGWVGAFSFLLVRLSVTTSWITAVTQSS